MITRVVLVAALTALAAGAAPARAQSPPPAPAPPTAPAVSLHDESPYQLHLEIDLPIIAGGMLLWQLPFLIVSPIGPPPACDPCDPAGLNIVDRPFAGIHDPRWRAVSHGIVAAPIAAFILLDVLDAGIRRWRSWGTDLAVIFEALVLDGILVEIFRRTVARPRPYLYTPDAYPEDRTKSEATFSFYSGHASAIFTLAAGIAYTWQLRHPTSRWRWAVWASLLAVASISPITRVAAGDHFPTDVLVGAVVGTGFGVLVPALHRRRDRAGTGISVSLLPSIGNGGGMITLAGSF